MYIVLCFSLLDLNKKQENVFSDKNIYFIKLRKTIYYLLLKITSDTEQ